MLTHRNKKPYECDVGGCGKSYCDARSLRRHKENHHNSNNSANTATALVPVQLGIPGIANLNLNSLQSAFAGIPRINANNSGTNQQQDQSANRIRYAPPLTQEASTLSQLLGSFLPTAATQLQILAFQQAPAAPPPNHQSSASPVSVLAQTSQRQITLVEHPSTPLREHKYSEGRAREGNRMESPTNSSQAMDLTSVAPPTNAPSSRIVTVTQTEVPPF